MTSLQLAQNNQRQALEARFALRVTAAMSEREIDHDIAQRLRFAREGALARVQQARRAATSTPVFQVGGGGAAFGAPSWWLRLASIAPLMALALGLVLIDRIGQEEQIQAAAEIDAVLLADELPPRAYTDPGFGEFLKQPTP